MTDDELDRRLDRDSAAYVLAQDPELDPYITALARRGLRAERETCGRCEWQRLGSGNCCAPFGLEGNVGPGDYCSRWRERTKP